MVMGMLSPGVVVLLMMMDEFTYFVVVEAWKPSEVGWIRIVRPNDNRLSNLKLRSTKESKHLLGCFSFLL